MINSFQMPGQSSSLEAITLGIAGHIRHTRIKIRHANGNRSGHYGIYLLALSIGIANVI